MAQRSCAPRTNQGGGHPGSIGLREVWGHDTLPHPAFVALALAFNASLATVAKIRIARGGMQPTRGTCGMTARSTRLAHPRCFARGQ